MYGLGALVALGHPAGRFTTSDAVRDVCSLGFTFPTIPISLRNRGHLGLDKAEPQPDYHQPLTREQTGETSRSYLTLKQ